LTSSAALFGRSLKGQAEYLLAIPLRSNAINSLYLTGYSEWGFTWWYSVPS